MIIFKISKHDCTSLHHGPTCV